MARTPEGKVEDYLVEQSAVYGALVRKLAYVGRRGAPDRMVVWPGFRLSHEDERAAAFLKDVQRIVAAELPGTAIVDFVELKAQKKKPDPHQEREHARLRAQGCNVYVIDSKEAVDHYIAMRK